MMDRLACVDAAPLRLQILRRDVAADAADDQPIVVVDRDTPTGVVLELNECARDHGVLPGMRYAAALTLAPGLEAGAVREGRVRSLVSDLATRLRHFSPFVEASADEPGVFWIDARGLAGIFASASSWAADMRDMLEARHITSSVCVGFSRFGTYAAARIEPGVRVFRSIDEERRAVEQVVLDRLGLPPKAVNQLHRLGVERVHNLLALPPGGLRERFGPEVDRCALLARGALRLPLTPTRDPARYDETHHLDSATRSRRRLGRIVQRLVGKLAGQLEQSGGLARGVTLSLYGRAGLAVEETVAPAVPTTDAAVLTDLVILRLDSQRIKDPVDRVCVVLGACQQSHVQTALTADPGGAARADAASALAKIQAMYGQSSVAAARLVPGHLPEAQFDWAATDVSGTPRPARRRQPTVVRRFYASARRARGAPPVADAVLGAYRVSGGWWASHVDRRYGYLVRKEGVVWCFYDPTRARWFVQGYVE